MEEVKLDGYIKEFLLGIYLLISLRLLLRTPLEKLVLLVEAGLEVSLILGLLIFILIKSFSKSVSRFQLYIIVLCGVPLISALAAYVNFSQPITYGLLAQRDFYLCIAALFLFEALKKDWVKIKNVQNVLIWLSWASLIMYVLVNLSVNPAPFKQTGFVGYNDLKGGYLFRFNMTLIVFASLFYFISFLRKRHYWHLMYFVFFFGYLAFIRQDRTIVLTVLICLGIIAIKYTNFKKHAIPISILSAVIFMITSIMLMLKPSFTERIVDLYDNSFNVVANLDSQEDRKGNGTVRIKEAQVATTGFFESPILGQGILSKQFEGGFQAIYGHFYPSEVGILGLLFLYGIVGVSFVFYQMVLLARYWIKSGSNQPILVIASQFFVLQNFLNSLTDGRIMLRASVSLIFLTIVYFNFYRMKNEVSI